MGAARRAAAFGRVDQHREPRLEHGVGILIALWSAGVGVRALITALNIAYHEEEKRGFVSFYAVAFLFTVSLIGAAVLGLIVIVVVPVVLQFLPLGSLATALVKVFTWLVLAAIVIAGLALLYRYGPSRSHARLRWVTWGAIAAAGLWLLASFAFQVYAANFANYSATYGSLGAVIALLMWFWVSAFVVLLGAELNAEMEHRTRKDSTPVGKTARRARRLRRGPCRRSPLSSGRPRASILNFFFFFFFFFLKKKTRAPGIPRRTERFLRPAQLLEPRPVQQGTAVAVVDVFLDEHVAGAGDLALELEHLAIDRAFFLLGIGAHACVQNRSFHTTPLIPEPRQGVESRAGDNVIAGICRS